MVKKPSKKIPNNIDNRYEFIITARRLEFLRSQDRVEIFKIPRNGSQAEIEEEKIDDIIRIVLMNPFLDTLILSSEMASVWNDSLNDHVLNACKSLERIEIVAHDFEGFDTDFICLLENERRILLKLRRNREAPIASKNKRYELNLHHFHKSIALEIEKGFQLTFNPSGSTKVVSL